MGQSITAEEKVLLDLFSKSNRYIIPSYQRPYSWGEEECSILWEDLKFVFENNRNEKYFLGNIVLAESKANIEVEVIDGQQRLITLIIILHLLNLKKENRDLTEAIWHIDRDTDEKSPRVKTLIYEDNNNTNFEDILTLTKDNIKNIDIRIANQFKENLLFFYNHIEELGESKITQFRNFLLDKIYVLSIKSVDLEEDKAREKALIIFETINNRGLELSDADIFKSQLYNSALNNGNQDDFINRWTALVEFARGNDYILVDVFRIYTHILRGKNGETGNEIGLRAFFSQENDSYIPLRKRDYNEVIDDLNKILLTVDFFNTCVKNEYPAENPYNKFSRWLQVIDEHTSNYPRFVIFVYLFYNSIEKDNNLSLNKNQIEKLILLSKNIIKYSYMHTSTMKIKFEIFKIMTNIALEKEYRFPDKFSVEQQDDFKLLRLKDGRKKGFILLAIYLNKEQKVIYPYYFHKIITNINQKQLNNSWENRDYNKYSNSIGNLIVTDNKRKTQDLKNRVINYKSSKILDLQKLSNKLENFNYTYFQEREEKLNAKLVEFFLNKK